MSSFNRLKVNSSNLLEINISKLPKKENNIFKI